MNTTATTENREATTSDGPPMASTSTSGAAPPLPPPSKRSKTNSSAVGSTATIVSTSSTSTSAVVASSGRRSTAVLDLSTMLKAAAKNDDNVSDDEVAEVEEVADYDESPPTLVKPGSSCTAPCWEYFMKFDKEVHPQLKNYSQCMLCTVRINRGPDNSTGGMKKHVRNKHFEEFCRIVEKEAKAKEDAAQQEKRQNPKSRITGHFRQKDKLTDAEAKQLYLVAASTCAATHGLPLSLFEKPAFRKMFTSVSKSAAKVVNIGSTSLRTEILTLGMITSVATHKELVGKRVSYTSDHWTGPNDETYTTVTAHYISEDWVMMSVCIDFKVFQGRTTGENIYSDIMAVLTQFVSEGHEPDFVQDTIGITDTTGNMGKLGKFLRDSGHEHAYCTDHVFHLTAILAFSGKSFHYGYYS